MPAYNHFDTIYKHTLAWHPFSLSALCTLAAVPFGTFSFGCSVTLACKDQAAVKREFTGVQTLFCICSLSSFHSVWFPVKVSLIPIQTANVQLNI